VQGDVPLGSSISPLHTSSIQFKKGLEKSALKVENKAMASEDSKKDEYKLKQKARARQARKAAYAYQKAKMQERKDAQKADPEFKKAQQLKKAEQKQRYKDFKAKILDQERTAKNHQGLEGDSVKGKLVLASTNSNYDSQKDSLKKKDETPDTTMRPKLRLVAVNEKA
jgi:hypothetical protein